MEHSRKRLLFVDDEPYILEMLGRMLYQCGEDWEAEWEAACSAVETTVGTPAS